VNPGLFASIRRPNRMSCQNVSMSSLEPGRCLTRTSHTPPPISHTLAIRKMFTRSSILDCQVPGDLPNSLRPENPVEHR
jgi:hypothetical protein